LTPHIIRIPDVTAEDLEPVYVGTDSNISFQGSPRVESPATTGPFDFSRREPAVSVPRGAIPPQPVVTPAPQILAPGGLPNDPFRPTPNPRDAIPPQPTPPPPSGAAISQSSEAVAFDFDPPAVSLAPGEQKTILVRATGDESAPATILGIQFDPAVVAVAGVRSVLGDGVLGATSSGTGRLVLELPGGISLAGTRPVAEITLRGIGAGRTNLAIEKPSTGAVLAATDASIEVRTR
jgi:hypothetical protein